MTFFKWAFKGIASHSLFFFVALENAKKLRFALYSQIDSIGVSGDKKGLVLRGCMAYRTRNIHNQYCS